MTEDELARIIAEYLVDRDDVADVETNTIPSLRVITQGGTEFVVDVAVASSD